MLSRLGIRQVTLGGADDNLTIDTIDTQIEILRRHGIKVAGWYVDDFDEPTIGVNWRNHRIDAKTPNTLTVGELLEAFKRHGIKPDLWLARNMRLSGPTPLPAKPVAEWTNEELNEGFRRYLNYDPTPPERRELRVHQEVEHLKPLVDLTASYGITVALYKHGGWIGVTDNMIAVIQQLKVGGAENICMVYRFIHAHDEVDDTIDFPAVWKGVQPYVRVVDITGVHAGRTAVYPILYPSQGALELNMLKTIQNSGWEGTIGISAEKGAGQSGEAGDSEINLRSNLIGLDWIADELKRPGSGGPRPFPPAD
jgi:hypothetical protein